MYIYIYIYIYILTYICVHIHKEMYLNGFNQSGKNDFCRILSYSVHILEKLN